MLLYVTDLGGGTGVFKDTVDYRYNLGGDNGAAREHKCWVAQGTGESRMSVSRRLEVGNYRRKIDTTTTTVGCVYITRSRRRV